MEEKIDYKEKWVVIIEDFLNTNRTKRSSTYYGKSFCLNIVKLIDKLPQPDISLLAEALQAISSNSNIYEKIKSHEL